MKSFKMLYPLGMCVVLLTSLTSIVCADQGAESMAENLWGRPGLTIAYAQSYVLSAGSKVPEESSSSKVPQFQESGDRGFMSSVSLKFEQKNWLGGLVIGATHKLLSDDDEGGGDGDKDFKRIYGYLEKMIEKSGHGVKLTYNFVEMTDRFLLAEPITFRTVELDRDMTISDISVSYLFYESGYSSYLGLGYSYVTSSFDYFGFQGGDVVERKGDAIAHLITCSGAIDSSAAIGWSSFGSIVLGVGYSKGSLKMKGLAYYMDAHGGASYGFKIGHSMTCQFRLGGKLYSIDFARESPRHRSVDDFYMGFIGPFLGLLARF